LIGTILAVGWVAVAEYLARERAARPELFEELGGRRPPRTPPLPAEGHSDGVRARTHEVVSNV
jgi:hypothetical protein